MLGPRVRLLRGGPGVSVRPLHPASSERRDDQHRQPHRRHAAPQVQQRAHEQPEAVGHDLAQQQQVERRPERDPERERGARRQRGASPYSSAAHQRRQRRAPARAASKVAYQGMPSMRPVMTPSRASEMIFSAHLGGGHRRDAVGRGEPDRGNRIAICITPVAVSSHERPSALNTAPGMLASDARPGPDRDERHRGGRGVATPRRTASAPAAARAPPCRTPAGQATIAPSRTVCRYPRRSVLVVPSTRPAAAGARRTGTARRWPPGSPTGSPAPAAGRRGSRRRARRRPAWRPTMR